MVSPLVRFAPSPTGHLHVGNMRTALVNYLFARANQGRFMLRIDDTDDERSDDIFEASIRFDLEWMGMNWDCEDRQSSRLDHYHNGLESLLKSGRAYPCFESQEELSLKRKSQLSAGRPPVYDRSALKLSQDEIESRKAGGEVPHYRFLLNHDTTSWQDMVRGEQSIQMSSLSDPVILRADGRFIYTLASVIDDGDHGITHILRGEDHTTNSAAQIQLFEALGYAVPAMGHFALLAGADGEGLSKRIGSLSIGSLRDEGIEAMAIASLLARIGTSDPVEVRANMDDLVAGFDISRFGRATPRFDPEQLRQINGKVLAEFSFAQVKDRLDSLKDGDLIWDAVKGNISNLAEVKEWADIIHEAITPVISDPVMTAAAITALDALADHDIDDGFWGHWTKQIMQETGLKGKAVFMPLRQALTGRQSGPEMAMLLPLIGRERMIGRLKGEAC
jgi:glutamyl-tRNA synthetase